jgi:isopentenyl diphosphate isomerase/L-lactate dehydrogenase-like FMN-dependent dehydrogenase
MTGFAGPLLRAAAISEEETIETLTTFVEEVRLAMFCTGSRAIADLKRADLLVNDREHWEFAGEGGGRYRFTAERTGRDYVG